MKHTETEFAGLLLRARAGDREAAGELLEVHRPYLRMLARRQLDGRLGVRFDASDIAQQTCLSAFRNLDKFAGDAPGEFIAWLRRIHEQNLQNLIRDHVVAERRAVTREQPVGDTQVRDRPADRARQSSPSQRAMRDENAVRLARAIDQLPEDQREAVRLRFLEGWSLDDITAHFGRSKEAVTGLVKRGVQNLRKLLVEDET